MSNAIGIISSNYSTDFLGKIFKDRPIAAVPFAGRYKLLDFALSSMVNSGLRTIGIIMPRRYRPILDHLGTGKAWYLDRKSGGLFILPGSEHGGRKEGNCFSVRDFLRNVRYLELDYREQVIISGCNNIFNIDYRPVLATHRKNAADVTMIYKEQEGVFDGGCKGIALETNGKGRVVGFKETQMDERAHEKVFVDIFIINRLTLLSLIREGDYPEDTSLIDIIGNNLDVLKVEAGPLQGYYGKVYSGDSYYQCSMEMLNLFVRNKLFLGKNRIHTKIHDSPPTRYGPGGGIRDSLVSSGCYIQGEVDNSIIFRGVHVKPGARVKNSIILKKCVIGRDVILENAVLDKYVRVTGKTTIRGEKELPVVVGKYSVV